MKKYLALSLTLSCVAVLAIHAYELGTPEERLELRVPLVQKWHRLFPAEPPKEKAAIAARFSAAFKLPVARPAAAAAR